MRWRNFRYLLLIVVLFFPIKGFSINDNDTIIKKDTVIIRDTVFLAPIQNDKQNMIYTQKSEYTNKRDRRIHRYRRFWGALIPTNFKIQYAGGMGLFSVGAGWDYGKRAQWETDLMFGYVPKYCTNTGKFVMSVKQTYIPWSIFLYDKFDLEPLSCGLYFTKIFGDDFWINEPDGYPDNYYGFSTSIRANIYIGQRIKYEIPKEWHLFVKSVSFFYEISSCDLYIVTAFINSSMSLKDYIRLAVGFKFQIF